MNEISKIKIEDNKSDSSQVYNVKDELLRHQINVLLGIEKPDERDK